MDMQESFGLMASSGKRISLPVGALELQRHPGIRLRAAMLQLKAPRILSLLAETRPEEADVKSEAAFRRLVRTSLCSLGHLDQRLIVADILKRLDMKTARKRILQVMMKRPMVRMSFSLSRHRVVLSLSASRSL